MTNETKVEQTSDLERVVTRTFNAPAAAVFDAWTKPELMKQWWTPKSMPMSLDACAMDVRTGGTYRLTFTFNGMPPMDFFGRYIEVVPGKKLVWTNEEAGADGSTTMLTFDEHNGQTLVTQTERYPSKEALEADGAHEAAFETHRQLDELLQSVVSREGARRATKS